ncbi:MAG: Hsp20/alpha crystallin family protein [Gammaproteobacteria bacterium]
MNNLSGIYPPFSHLLQEFAPARPDAGFRVDIEEDEKEYRIRADLPGVIKDNVSLNAEDNVLTVAAKFEESSENALRSERISGEYSRSFRLPRIVDAQNIAASMKNGVLTVSLPKAKTESAGRKIEIA